MSASQSAKALIRESFASVPFPGDDDLRGSSEGDEPFRVEASFRGRNDWSTLPAEFIDQAPNGLGSALSFFSDAAFRFYIAAYMLADLDGLLERSNQMFHLTYGLDHASRNECINPRRYGTMTWFERAKARFQHFDSKQREAVAAYLVSKLSTGGLLEEEVESINQALEGFWLQSAA
jgi:hypothetical protein